MEQMKNKRRMIDISTGLFEGTSSLAMKDKSTSEDNLSIPSFQYKAPVNKFIYKNGVRIEHDTNASMDKHLSLLKKNKIMAVKNFNLKNLQQNSKGGQFINIHEASSNLLYRPMCPHCRKILTPTETLESHYRFCKPLYVYACEKCSFVTRNKPDLIRHHAVHAQLKCPKCSQLFENQKNFTLHLFKGCEESSPKNLYTCKVCAFSSNRIFSLKAHMKVHAADSESVEIGKNTCPPKDSNNKFGQGVIVVTAKSLYAKEYDDVADIADVESLPLNAQNDSVEQNGLDDSPQDQSIINTLIATNRDHAYSKIKRIASENSTNLIKHTDLYRNKSNTYEIVSTNEGLDLGIDNSIVSANSKNLNELADMYRKEPSTSEIICIDEDPNIGIDGSIVSANSKNLNERTDVYRKEPNTSEIVFMDEDSSIDIDKSVASASSQNSNDLADMYGEEPSTSEIVYIDEGLNSGNDRRVASKNSANLNKQVDVCRQKPTSFEIVCVNGGLNLDIDRRVVSENPTNLNQQVDVHRKNSSTSKIVCRSWKVHSIDHRRRSKKKKGDKVIVRYCVKCKTKFEIENYCETRPLCTTCDSKLFLQCTECNKVMKEYFVAIEHSESDCDKQETLCTQRQVGLPSEQNGLSQTNNSSNIYINNLPSLDNDNQKKKIIRYCQKCKNKSNIVCYYDERPRCMKCRTKLHLKCILCHKLMTEYFVAVEHTELNCNPKKQVRRKKRQPQRTVNPSISEDRNDNNCETVKEVTFETAKEITFETVQEITFETPKESSRKKQQQEITFETVKEITFETPKESSSPIVNSSFSKDLNHFGNETEREITVETTKKRTGRITYDIKSAKVTKICPQCNITAEFDVTSQCKTCNRGCIFQCNRCKKSFDNYHKVSIHLWTQCFQEGFYHCLKCIFKSTVKLTVYRHCEEQHPEFSDPLGSVKEGDYIEYRAIEYRAIESNENSNLLPQNISYQSKIPKPTKRVERQINVNVPARYSRTCHHCKTTYSSRHNFIKHLVHCTKPRVFACEYCPFSTKTQFGLRNHVLSCHSNLPSNNEDSYVNSIVHRSPETDVPPYKCRFCNHVAQRRTALQMHEGRVHSNQLRELLGLNERNWRKHKVYQCNVCPFKIVNKLGELRQHILKIHMKGQDASTLPPCERCGWNFQGCWGLKKHLAYCGKKLFMQCSVNLVRLKIKPPVVLNDNLGEPIEEDLTETVKEDVAETIKEEAVDLGEFQMEVEP